jgi:hypothetical protein
VVVLNTVLSAAALARDARFHQKLLIHATHDADVTVAAADVDAPSRTVFGVSRRMLRFR